jgi:molybdenum cofactor synthesis domain-containing protein
VLSEEPAGIVVTEKVSPGTAVRISTGAAIPAGADAVVMVEHTALRQAQDADRDVLICCEAERGENTRPAGEDVKRGEVVLRSGVRIGPAEMGMLASLGRARVQVHKRPRVALITTGSEVVDVCDALGPGQIRDSNRYCLLGQALSCGATVSMLQRVSDDSGELERALTEAAETSDVIITAGGVSVGKYDLVRDTLAALGEVRFWRVAIKPGKPLAYGHIAGKPVFGLPGNPVSAMVTFDLFVRPALLRMSGAQNVSHATVSSIVQQDIGHDAGRREFVRAVTVWRDGGYVSTPTGNQGSGRLSSMLGANSYLVVPETRGDIRAGERLEVLLRDL